MTDVRCPNGILFGVLDEGAIEIKCRSAYCGHGPGAVVIHRFDLATGKLLYTSRFIDPATRNRKASQ